MSITCVTLMLMQTLKLMNSLQHVWSWSPEESVVSVMMFEILTTVTQQQWDTETWDHCTISTSSSPPHSLTITRLDQTTNSESVWFPMNNLLSNLVFLNLIIKATLFRSCELTDVSINAQSTYSMFAVYNQYLLQLMLSTKDEIYYLDCANIIIYDRRRN